MELTASKIAYMFAAGMIILGGSVSDDTVMYGFAIAAFFFMLIGVALNRFEEFVKLYKLVNADKIAEKQKQDATAEQ